jgi:hypothetical protein
MEDPLAFTLGMVRVVIATGMIVAVYMIVDTLVALAKDMKGGR